MESLSLQQAPEGESGRGRARVMRTTTNRMDRRGKGKRARNEIKNPDTTRNAQIRDSGPDRESLGALESKKLYIGTLSGFNLDGLWEVQLKLGQRGLSPAEVSLHAEVSFP